MTWVDLAITDLARNLSCGRLARAGGCGMPARIRGLAVSAYPFTITHLPTPSTMFALDVDIRPGSDLGIFELGSSSLCI